MKADFQKPFLRSLIQLMSSKYIRYFTKKSILLFSLLMFSGYATFQYFTAINLKNISDIEWTLSAYINPTDSTAQKRINFLIDNTCFSRPVIEISNYHFNGTVPSVQIRYKFFDWVGGSDAFVCGNLIINFAQSRIHFDEAPIPIGCYDSLPYADKYVLTRLFSSPNKIIRNKNMMQIISPKTGIIFQFTNQKKGQV